MRLAKGQVAAVLMLLPERRHAPQIKPNAAAEIVDEYLRLQMIPDPDAARQYVAPNMQIRFTGGRVMHDPAECAAFNTARYRWVKKRVEHTETVVGGSYEQTVVYNWRIRLLAIPRTPAVHFTETTMIHASQTNTTQPLQDPGLIVEEFLRLIMIPDPQAASRFAAPDMAIRFTGGRAMQKPSDCTAFNASRYAWVKKRFERTDVVRDANAAEAIVYNIGTLYGAWLDGTPFEGNRYVDRYVLRDGLIVQMDVWNDSAEWLLVRAGLAAAWPSPMNPATSAA